MHALEAPEICEYNGGVFGIAAELRGSGPKLQLLDSADMVVVMMSDNYLESAQHRNELHIALCRQRMVSKTVGFGFSEKKARLAFPGESDLIFPSEEFLWNKKVVKETT